MKSEKMKEICKENLPPVLAELIMFGASRRLALIMQATPAPSRNRGKKTVRPPELQRAFDEAALSKIGFLEGLSSALDRIVSQATAAPNSEVFRAIADGWEAAHEFDLATCSKINKHVAIALCHILATVGSKNMSPTRWEIREFIQNETDDSFVEDSDWDHVWKQTGLADFLPTGTPSPLKFRRTGGL